MNEIEIVGRCMVLRELSVRRTHQASHWKVEPRGAELSFVVTKWTEVYHPIGSTRIFQSVGDRSVNLGIISSALLVGALPRISGTRKDKTMLYLGSGAFIRSK